MPKLVCRQCKYKMEVSKKMAERGVMCPECYCGNMKVVDSNRHRGAHNRVVDIHPRTIRMLVGGMMLFGIGVAGIAWSQVRMDQGGLIAARILGSSIALTVLAVLIILVGLGMIVRDLMR